jgi:hypothetical protein
MNKKKAYFSVGIVGCLAVMLMTGPAMAMSAQGIGGTSSPYGYYYNPYGYAGSAGNCSGYTPYGIAPYPQQPSSYCMYWRPPQWTPVQVMVPGRWETRPVWIPGQQITLYRPIPGYWQRTNVSGTPDVSVYQTPQGWYATPYQPQTSGGYFDSQGVWRPEK